MIPLLILQALLAQGPVDTSQLATKAEVQSSVASAVTAAMPAPCPVPLVDTLLGSAGVGTSCMDKSDRTRPASVQAKVTTTAADATWAITFDRPFTSPPSYVDARVYGQAQPYLCTVTNISATAADGKCYQLISTTLPATALALLNLVVSPIAPAGGGISVRVAAKQ